MWYKLSQRLAGRGNTPNSVCKIMTPRRERDDIKRGNYQPT